MKNYPKELKQEIRKLRQQGWSLGMLQKKFELPKTTIHSWIVDIQITATQLEQIRINALQALQEGREKSQNILKEKRIAKEKDRFTRGINKVGKLSNKQLFIAGIALYWAEGFKNKHEHRLGFCNSDPAMIKFYIHWLEKCLFVKKNNLVARLTVNSVYEAKTEALEKYWSHITGIPLGQFTKPFYQNTKWKRIYNEENYHGVLRIHVKDSMDHLLEMKGLVEGLKLNAPG